MRMIMTADEAREAHGIEVRQDAVVLCGPPRALRGPVMLANDTDAEVFVQQVPVKTDGKGAAPAPLAAPHLMVRARLQPRQVRAHQILLTLDPHTPPGTYESTITVADAEKPVRLIVQPKRVVSITPESLDLTGTEPGTTHQAQVLFANGGNVDVAVPSVRHNTALDMDLICRNVSFAVRDHGGKGMMPMLDALARGVRDDMANWVDIKVAEAGQVVRPGESVLLHVSLSLPDDIKPDRHYRGEVRIYDRLLTYTITPSPVPSRRKRRDKEAS
jgi:hypothetical protein